MISFNFIQMDHLVRQVLLLMLVRDLRCQSILHWERICPHWKYTSRRLLPLSHHHGWVPCRRGLSRHLLLVNILTICLVILPHICLRYNKRSGVLLDRLISHKIEFIPSILILLLVVFLTARGSCGHCRIRILTIGRVEHGCATLPLLGVGKWIGRIHASCHIWKIKTY